MNYQRLDIFSLPANFRGRSAFIVQLWWIVQGTLFAWSPQFLYNWRRFLLRLFGAQIGKNVLVRPSVKITYPWKLKIGDYSWIGDDSVLYSLGHIEIGEHTALAQSVYICTGNHDYSKLEFDILAQPVKIGSQVWLTTDVFVGPGVTIGDGTIVGTRSTVLNDLPGGKICFGSPALPVKDRPINHT